ncbi:MAG: iron uptake porin [Cyanobacteriota bacterium]|nr:iron uptake porin [Cyanobacteriota bacterium]
MNSKTIGLLLRVSPVLVGIAALLGSTAASAKEAPIQQSKTQTVTETKGVKAASTSGELLSVEAEPELVAQVTSVDELSQLQTEDQLRSQVTSVSQLSDVQPTDWAFQALQSLVERYGCIAGYPDGTYRGNRPTTRYEFAAGLNACLDQILNLVDVESEVSAEDLAVIRRLQEEFAAELATLRGRVDALEARTAELEANQFSTTTKLRGEVIFAVADTFGNEAGGINSANPDREAGDDEFGDDTQTIFADRVRLTLDTSFTGTDRLRTRLQGRNITQFRRGLTGTNMTRLGFDGTNGNDVELDDVFYKFAARDNIEVIIAANSTEPRDFIDTVSPISSSGSGAISRFGRLNPVLRQPDGSAGLGLNIGLGDIGELSLAYLVDSDVASNPAVKNGLFNGQNAAMAHLVVEPVDAVKLGLSYVRYYAPGGEVNLSGSTGDFFASEPFGDTATSANSFGAQLQFNLSDSFIISGWYGLILASAEDNGVLPDNRTGDAVDDDDDATIMTGAVQFAFPDLGGDGNLFGLIAGIPPKVTDHDVTDLAEGDTAYHFEAFYRARVTDNILITPGAFVILNPANDDENDTQVVGTIRTTFKF